ncbi:transglycosylase-like protein with SLT domain [Novosphingobium sp. PhB57]|nr:transglycosylase-like protein with SLT domain [Novosphingobium sp. PhB57]
MKHMGRGARNGAGHPARAPVTLQKLSLASAGLPTLAILLGGLWWASPVYAAEPGAVSRWHAEIAEASQRFGIPEVWIEQVMSAESRGRTTLDGHPIRSVAGAMGLMQLMPGTWAEMRARLGLGGDPDAPRDNILAGTAYLREMYDRFGYPGLFAAYNAGPRRYAAALASGRRLPAETRAYLASVAGGVAGMNGAVPLAAGPSDSPSRAPQTAARQTIFVASTHVNAADDDGASLPKSPGAADPLFAIRTAP